MARQTIAISGELEARTAKGILADSSLIRYTYAAGADKGKEITSQEAIDNLYSRIVLAAGGFLKLYFTQDGIQVEPIKDTLKVFNNIVSITSIQLLDLLIDREGSFLVKLNDVSIGNLTIYKDDTKVCLILITNYNIQTNNTSSIRSYYRTKTSKWTSWELLNNKIEVKYIDNDILNLIIK